MLTRNITPCGLFLPQQAGRQVQHLMHKLHQKSLDVSCSSSTPISLASQFRQIFLPQLYFLFVLLIPSPFRLLLFPPSVILTSPFLFFLPFVFVPPLPLPFYPLLLLQFPAPLTLFFSLPFLLRLVYFGPRKNRTRVLLLLTAIIGNMDKRRKKGRVNGKGEIDGVMMGKEHDVQALVRDGVCVCLL